MEDIILINHIFSKCSSFVWALDDISRDKCWDTKVSPNNQCHLRRLWFMWSYLVSLLVVFMKLQFWRFCWVNLSYVSKLRFSEPSDYPWVTFTFVQLSLASFLVILRMPMTFSSFSLAYLLITYRSFLVDPKLPWASLLLIVSFLRRTICVWKKNGFDSLSVMRNEAWSGMDLDDISNVGTRYRSCRWNSSGVDPSR